MSVSSGSDITIPIQDSPPPPPSPYAGGGVGNGPGSKGTNDGGGIHNDANKSSITIIDTTAGAEDNSNNTKTPAESRGDVTVTVGFVNEGYQDHSPDSKTNGHTEKNGKIMTNGKGNGAISIAVPGADEKINGERTEIRLNEAVNPELINMNILNTIPDKPNPEYGPYDNMDEYFVPVNQHKKFLRRSEKLYVTKDKRKESRWKKYVCWLVGASVLATIVTVAVLAGIGLIPQKSPSSFDTESVVGTTTTTETDPSSASSSSDPTDLIISSSPDSSSSTPPSVPTLDGTHVPTSADINFHINNLNFEPALYNKSSERFQELASEVQEQVKDILKQRAGLGTVYARVTEFSTGSVHVKMRLGWLDQSISMEKVKFILSNVTSVGHYTITPISTYSVVNHCKFNNNGCNHNCSYNFVSMDFYCFCDDDTFYLAEDKKTCKSVFDSPSSTSTTPSTSSESAFIPDFSSYSPVSEEPENEYSPSPSSEDGVSSSSHETYPTEVFVDQVPTSQPEEEKEPEQAVSQEPEKSEEVSEPETSTNADIPLETLPVSQEQHHSSEEMFVIAGSSTTSTTTTTTEAPSEVSENVEHEHHHNLGASAAAEEALTTTTTTTTTTPVPEIMPVIPSSSEETDATENDQTDTTALPINEPTSQEKESREIITQSREEDFGRTDLSDEIARPTEQSLEEVQEEPIAAENATVIESPRDLDHDHVHDQDEKQVAAPVPTQVPESEEDEPAQTTFIPPSESESGEKSGETPSAGSSSLENVNEETTVSPTGIENEVEPEATTVLSEKSEESHDEQPHLITPMDVLSFSSHETSSTTTPTTSVEHDDHHHQPAEIMTTTSTTTQVPPVESPVAPRNEDTESDNSGQRESLEEDAETVSPGGPARSESLTEADEETVTESGVNGNRAPRLFSTELGNPLQSLGESDDLEKERSSEREEMLAPLVGNPQEEQGTNATESASVETADEKPETAAAVTSVSSEDSSKETVTQNNADETAPAAVVQEETEGQNQNNEENDQNESGQSGSNESSNVSSGIFENSSASSGSGEFSQESPVTSSSIEDDERPEVGSGEVTTFAPKSLQHDTDVNFLGNPSQDHSNTEQVQPAVVEVENVEGEHVQENNQDKEKLVSNPPTSEENVGQDPPPVDEPETPTTQPTFEEKEETPVESSAEERAPVVAVPDPLSHGLEETGGDSESREEETTRSVTSSSSSEVADPDASIEKQNRDNRDANSEIETPFASRTSEETTDANLDDEVMTTSLPEIAPSSTTSTTTTTPTPTTISSTTSTTTTTTTTTTTPVPVPEIVPEPISSTSTPASSIESNNSSSITHSDPLSHDESSSASLEGSSDNSHQHNSHEFPASREDEAVEPSSNSASTSASHEGAFPNDNNDVHDNELT